MRYRISCLSAPPLGKSHRQMWFLLDRARRGSHVLGLPGGSSRVTLNSIPMPARGKALGFSAVRVQPLPMPRLCHLSFASQTWRFSPQTNTKCRGSLLKKLSGSLNFSSPHTSLSSMPAIALRYTEMLLGSLLHPERPNTSAAKTPQIPAVTAAMRRREGNGARILGTPAGISIDFRSRDAWFGVSWLLAQQPGLPKQ